MLTYWLWVKRFLILTGILVVSLSVFNLIVDPNGVFGFISLEGFNKHKTDTLTDRITKFYYVKRFAPDTLILGTSRAAFLSPADLETYTKGRAFNLGTYASTIYQQYLFFKYMTDNYTVKNLVLGLDLLAFVSRNEEHQKFDAKRFDNSLYLKDYVESLFSFTAVQSSFITVKDNMFRKDIRQNDEQGFREFNHPKKALDDRYKKRLARREKRALKHFATQYTAGPFNDRELIAQNLSYLQKIIDIARAKNIHYRIYVSPFQSKLFDLIYASGIGESFEEWKRGIVRITDFVDFTGHNVITEDLGWWWDPSHIVSDGGKLIFARLYGDETVAIPKDFGVPVTKDSVDHHLALLRKGIQQKDLDAILR
jgi:hypothetical protein